MIWMFLKELRENFKWATIICGVLGVLTYSQIRSGDPLLLSQLSDRVIWVAAVAGLVMGLVQTLFETQPDNWAFVVHRPIPRVVIFGAKCAAGLLLLYVSLGLPCVMAATWAATPGNLPMPFQSRMVLPLLADVLAGGCFYFAGMILALRQASWFRSRLLPLGLPLATAGAVMFLIPDFWQALLLIAVVQGIGCVAAWGVFESAGAVDRIGPSKVALGVMVYCGAVLIGLSIQEVIPTFLYRAQRWQQYLMDREGNLLHVVWSRTTDNDRRAAITDASDRPLPQFEGIDIDDPAFGDRFIRFDASLTDKRFIPWVHRSVRRLDSYRSIIPGVIRLRASTPMGARMRSICLFNVERRTIELYDPVTRALEGTIGPAGFTSSRSQPAKLFPGPPLNPMELSNAHALAFPSVVYWMELHERQVRPIFTASLDDPVISAVELSRRTDQKVAIATRHHLHLVRSSGEPIVSIPHNWDWSKQYVQPATLPSNQNLVLFVANLPGQIDNRLRPEYLEFALDGQLVRRTALPAAPNLGGPKASQTAIFGLFYPLLARPLFPTWVVDAVIDLRCHEHPVLFHGFMVGSGLLCASATVFLGRRLGFRAVRTVAWSLANFVLGPAGLATMVSLSGWPARETCAACGRKRLVGRRDCPSCHQSIPPTKANGCEIFEPEETLQPTV